MDDIKGTVSIYSIPKLKTLPKEEILATAERMVSRGLLEWIDKNKGLVKITIIGEGIYEGGRESN